MKTKIIVVISIIGVAVLLNGLYIRSMMRDRIVIPPSESVGTAGGIAADGNVIEGGWALLEQVEVEMDLEDLVAVRFPESVLQAEGRQMRLAGMAFFLKNGIVDEKIHKFMLIPAKGIIWCCVPIPKPRAEWTVLVDCSNDPWPIPEQFGPMQIAVEGELKLNEPNSIDYVYQLVNTRIVPMKPEEVIDTKGIDICGVLR